MTFDFSHFGGEGSFSAETRDEIADEVRRRLARNPDFEDVEWFEGESSCLRMRVRERDGVRRYVIGYIRELRPQPHY